MGKTLIMDHPLIQHKIGILRSTETGTKDFRELVGEIATLECYEATRDLALEDYPVETPMGKTIGKRLAGNGNGNGNFAATVARSAAIVESVEEKGISRFISPSGVENAAIREENACLKRELYDVVGLAVQSPGRELQTAESKAWDFQNVCQFLAARADLLEQAERNAWLLMQKFDPGVKIPRTVYNRKFAVRDLAGSIAGLLQLKDLDSGPEFRKALRRSALDLLDALGTVGASDRNRILEEIERTA